MKEGEYIVAFNVMKHTFDIYKDLSVAAGAIDMSRSTLNARLRKHRVFYTGGFFIGYASYHKSTRGGNSGAGQGFKSY